MSDHINLEFYKRYLSEFIPQEVILRSGVLGENEPMRETTAVAIDLLLSRAREINTLHKQLAYEKERREELLRVAVMPHLHRSHPYEYALLTAMLTGPRQQSLLDTMLWGWGAKKVHAVLDRECRRKRIYYVGRYHHKSVHIDHLRIEPKGIYRLSSLTNIDVSYLLNF